MICDRVTRESLNPMGFLKNVLKRSAFLNRRLISRRAALQEKQYLHLCENAYQRTPGAFGPSGNQVKAKEMFLQGWSGPRDVKKSLKDVHLFLIDRPSVSSPWFEEELARSFKVSVFSTTRHKIGYIEGYADLVSFSDGIDPADRLRRAFFPENYAEWRYKLQKDILDAVERVHLEKRIDFCFAYGTSREFAPETLKRIRQMGIPVSVWYLDEKHGFLRNQEPLIGSYDLHLSNSFETMRWYLARGQASYYFPQAADPSIYSPRNQQRDIPVSFVGAAYGWRIDFIKTLRKAGVSIECFGSGWPNGVVDDIVDIFSRSRINLGFGFTGSSKRLTCIKERDFQVPATCSLYLTTYNPELTHLYVIGRDILCHRNEFDCLDLIRYYLDHIEEAEAVASAGFERFRKKHSWTNRMTELLQWMGILEPSIGISRG